MTTRLENLTIGQFIDLLAGDTSVLLGKREKADQDTINKAVRDIVYEYNCIADPPQAASYLRTMEEMLKAMISVQVFTMCVNLVSLDEYDYAREVLSECGIKARTMNDARIAAEARTRLERAKRTVSRIKDENMQAASAKADIRREFDGQTAALMAYFKFQLDTSAMKATVYAHLVARHNREIKAQLAALKRK